MLDPSLRMRKKNRVTPPPWAYNTPGMRESRKFCQRGPTVSTVFCLFLFFVFFFVRGGGEGGGELVMGEKNEIALKAGHHRSASKVVE